MSIRWPLVCLLTAVAALVGVVWSTAGEPQKTTRPPNILLIVADDLGFSDLGSLGGEIRTPNLDGIARRGVRLTGFYTSPACSPTRAMLLTGADNHKVGLGSMAELLTSEQRGAPGYEGYLNERAATLAERLKLAGFDTMMTGKWHLGTNSGQFPSDRGFDRSFALLQGDHNHFGYDQGPAYRRLHAGRDYVLNGQPAEFPTGIYSDDYFTTKLIGFLKQAKANRPFFAYLSFTGPHWPLQAPTEDIARYRHHYDAGPVAVQKARLERMKRLGIVEDDVIPYPVDAATWDRMSAQERSIELRKMEVYAAMVDRLDQNVGRIIDYLKRSGQLDNTIIIFLSDNGPEGYPIERPFDLRQPGKVAGTSIDNSLESIGTAQSYIGVGPLWAQVSSTPFRGVKLEMTEGGIRTPAIIAGPGVRRARLNGTVTHVTDVVPTVLDFVHASVARVVKGKPVIASEGRSWMDLLAGHVSEVRSEKDVVGWELVYRRAVRTGRWKAVFQPSLIPLFKEHTPLDQVHWQLFDLKRDPSEIHDRAADEPRRLNTMMRQWERYAARNGVVPPNSTSVAPSGETR